MVWHCAHDLHVAPFCGKFNVCSGENFILATIICRNTLTGAAVLDQARGSTELNLPSIPTKMALVAKSGGRRPHHAGPRRGVIC